MTLKSRLIWIVLSLLVLCSICAHVSANDPPSVIITKSAGSAVVGQSITFDASGSRDPEGGPLTFLWSFFDLDIEKSGPTVSQSYPTPGTKTVGLTVTDNQGAKTISSAVIVVTSPQSGVKTQVTTPVTSVATTQVPSLVNASTTTPVTNITTTQRPSNITGETTTIVPAEVVTGVTPGGTSAPAPAVTDGTAIKPSGDAGTGSSQVPAQNPAGAAAGGSPVNIYVVLGVMAIILVGIFGFIMFKKQ
jgi:hypothetical protein